jgi:hypothetical protein
VTVEAADADRVRAADRVALYREATR